MAFIYFATQIDKCREKVWKKGVEFEEGKKDLSSKGLFPLLKEQPLLGTEPEIKKLHDHSALRGENFTDSASRLLHKCNGAKVE